MFFVAVKSMYLVVHSTVVAQISFKESLDLDWCGTAARMAGSCDN